MPTPNERTDLQCTAGITQGRAHAEQFLSDSNPKKNRREMHARLKCVCWTGLSFIETRQGKRHGTGEGYKHPRDGVEQAAMYNMQQVHAHVTVQSTALMVSSTLRHFRQPLSMESATRMARSN